MFLIFDLETTGLDSYRCGITEVSAYRFENGRPVEEFTTLIDPERAIPKEISELTGITPDMVLGKPKINKVLSELVGEDINLSHFMLVNKAAWIGPDVEWHQEVFNIKIYIWL